MIQVSIVVNPGELPSHNHVRGNHSHEHAFEHGVTCYLPWLSSS